VLSFKGDALRAFLEKFNDMSAEQRVEMIGQIAVMTASEKDKTVSSDSFGVRGGGGAYNVSAGGMAGLVGTANGADSRTEYAAAAPAAGLLSPGGTTRMLVSVGS
jgi:hypothetical protein